MDHLLEVIGIADNEFNLVFEKIAKKPWIVQPEVASSNYLAFSLRFLLIPAITGHGYFRETFPVEWSAFGRLKLTNSGEN